MRFFYVSYVNFALHRCCCTQISSCLNTVGNNFVFYSICVLNFFSFYSNNTCSCTTYTKTTSIQKILQVCNFRLPGRIVNSSLSGVSDGKKHNIFSCPDTRIVKMNITTKRLIYRADQQTIFFSYFNSKLS